MVVVQVVQVVQWWLCVCVRWLWWFRWYAVGDVVVKVVRFRWYAVGDVVVLVARSW